MSGMLGNAAMQEPEEVVSQEQQILTLRLRLMAEQVSRDEIEAELRRAKIALSSFRHYHNKVKGIKEPKRFSFSLTRESALELEEYLRVARKSLLKSPPKGVTKFSEMLTRRVEERKSKP